MKAYTDIPDVHEDDLGKVWFEVQFRDGTIRKFDRANYAQTHYALVRGDGKTSNTEYWVKIDDVFCVDAFEKPPTPEEIAEKEKKEQELKDKEQEDIDKAEAILKEPLIECEDDDVTDIPTNS